jgi:predicted DNA-binding transcriptional regulator AlpA
MNQRTFLSAKEAAAYLRVSTSTLARFRAQRRGPKARKPAGRILYAVDDLDQWLESSDLISKTY